MKKIVLLAATAFAMNCFAQTANNKLSFQKGQKLQVEMQMNSTMTTAFGESQVKATLTQEFDVLDVVDGNATIQHSIKHLKGSFESVMGSKDFDSDNEKDMSSETGKSLEKMLHNTYTVTVDPSGKVLTVTSADTSKTKSAPAGEDMVGNLLSQMIEGVGAPAVGDGLDFRILPDKEVGKGDTWTDASKNIVYTLTDLNDNEIAVSFTQELTTEKKQELMGMEISITSKDKTTGKLTIDKKTGLLKEKTASTDSEGTMEAMGQSGPLNVKTTKLFTVK